VSETKQVSGVSVDWEEANNAAADWALNHSNGLVRGILETTRERLRREIANFVQNQESIGQLAARLNGDNGPFSASRARMIAVTEVTRSYAEGNKVAWQESGVIEGQQWNTANDELVCSICGPLDGTQAALGGQFDGGYDGPPAHPRCRCWLTPVVMGDVRTGAEIFEEYGLERMPGIGAEQFLIPYSTTINQNVGGPLPLGDAELKPITPEQQAQTQASFESAIARIRNRLPDFVDESEWQLNIINSEDVQFAGQMVSSARGKYIVQVNLSSIESFESDGIFAANILDVLKKTENPDWLPMYYARNMEEIIVHEIAHASQNHARNIYGSTWGDWGDAYIEVMRSDTPGAFPTFYAQESPAELWAETVTGLTLDLPVPDTVVTRYIKKVLGL